MREQVGFELGDLAGLDRRADDGFDHAESVALGDLAPALPAEHRRTVDQHDALHLRRAAGLEEEPHPGTQLGERAGEVAERCGDAFGQLLLDLFVDGEEQVLLAGELVVERPRVTPARRTISSVPTAA